MGKQKPQNYRQEQVSKVSDKNRVLACIVCGYERGGTTLISQILLQHPCLESGFEGGFLLPSEISEFPVFEPYSSMVRVGWQLPKERLEFVCNAKNWLEIYERLHKVSPICSQQEGVRIFDKTPKYMENLDEIMAKIPNIPCILIVRDPRAVLWSWARRSGLSPQNWAREHLQKSCDRYVAYGQGWIRAKKQGFSSLIHMVQYEKLCTNKNKEARKIFRFLDLDFDKKFLEFGDDKFENVHENKISNKYLRQYKTKFSDEICLEILERTSLFKDWFWEE